MPNWEWPSDIQRLSASKGLPPQYILQVETVRANSFGLSACEQHTAVAMKHVAWQICVALASRVNVHLTGCFARSDKVYQAPPDS